MEPARSTGNFNRRITVADSNNIITVLDMNAANSKYQIFDQDYLVEFQAVLEDLKITVALSSLLEAPWPDTNALMSESATMAEIAKIRTQGQKISLGLYVASGNGPWQYESEVVLQNQGGSETHVPILVPFLSSNETLLMAGNFRLGVKIEPKWNQPLKLNDYLIVKGTWRQIVSFSKKKDDDVEMLSARIASLELAVNGKLINLPANTLLGRNVDAGIVAQIPTSQFATPAMINQAITNLVGGASGALDTLIELAASLNNDANFATTVTNALAAKAPIANPSFTGNATIAGQLNAGGSICPTISPLLNWGIDFATGASTINLATQATYDLATGSGMVVIYDDGDGNFNFVFTTGGAVVSAASTVSSSIVAGAPPSDKVGIFYNPGTVKYRILNNRSTARILIVSTIKMRAAS